MSVEQMNIYMSPKMAKFIRGKVKGGSYTNASEVVRTALRRMQEEEAREARLARPAADDILAGLTGDARAEITKRVRAGFTAIEHGKYTDYLGREGLAQLSAGVKARGRKLLAKAQPGT